MIHELTDEELIVLRRQLEEKKQDQLDIQAQIEEIDLQLNKLIDIQIRKRKKQLADVRHELSQQMYQNSFSISNLETTIYKKSYEIKEEE